MAPPDPPPAHVRRRRYPGKNPRAFHDKYKELNPEQYAADVEKVLASGRTPAGMHVPIMEREVLDCLRPRAGEIAVDCTLGWGGHAQAILERVQPGGRVIGIDVDPIELPRAEARLRAAGFGPDVFVARHAKFRGSAEGAGCGRAGHASTSILADLGVSSMQFDNPDRGFSYKGVGPLDMRMNPRSGETAAQLIARSTEDELARLLEENADEPHAQLIARLLKAAAARDDPCRRSPAAHRPQRGASAPDEGRPEDVDPQDISGAAHCGQRRVRRRSMRSCGRCRTVWRRAVASRC